MQKFNLERALAGEPVITRDGREITQLILFDDVDTAYPLRGVLDKEIVSWTRTGRYDIISQKPKDLIMKPKVMERWVNVYKSLRGFLFIGSNIYESEEDAIDAGNNDEIGYIKTIKITDEV